MKLLVSAMFFFSTLMAAAVVALGEPAQADVALARSAVPEHANTTQHARNRAASTEIVASKAGVALR